MSIAIVFFNALRHVQLHGLTVFIIMSFAVHVVCVHTHVCTKLARNTTQLFSHFVHIGSYGR